MLSFKEKTRIRENPYSGTFYAVGVLLNNSLDLTCLIYFFIIYFKVYSLVIFFCWADLHLRVNLNFYRLFQQRYYFLEVVQNWWKCVISFCSTGRTKSMHSFHPILCFFSDLFQFHMIFFISLQVSKEISKMFFKTGSGLM